MNPSKGQKDRRRRVLNRGSIEGDDLIHHLVWLFNLFSVCTYRCELTVAHLFKNPTNKTVLLSQKTLSTALPAEVCIFNLFSIILPRILIYHPPRSIFRSPEGCISVTFCWYKDGEKWVHKEEDFVKYVVMIYENHKAVIFKPHFLFSKSSLKKFWVP